MSITHYLLLFCSSNSVTFSWLHDGLADQFYRSDDQKNMGWIGALGFSKSVQKNDLIR